MDVFQDWVEEDLKALHARVHSSKLSRGNLSGVEDKALKDIKNNSDIIIRVADKGGAVVVLDWGLYRKLNMSLLGYRDTYTKLSGDPTQEYQKALRTLLDYDIRKGVLTSKIANC